MQLVQELAAQMDGIYILPLISSSIPSYGLSDFAS